MKHLPLALMVFGSALGLVRAQQDEQNRAPPTEIPDFSNLDEYVNEQKSTLIISQRRLSGAKTSFFGTGKLLAPELPTDATTPNILRTYHDGSVGADARIAGRLDGAGNPVIDPTTNGQIFDPVANDGHTNTWTYTDASQVTSDGYVAFHTYSAAVNDTAIRKKDANSAFGVEVSVARDMGKVFGTRATWSLMAGISINDISATNVDHVQAVMTTLTDLYSLDGQVVPAAPYTAPSSTTTSVVDAGGTQVVGSDGTPQSVTTDTTTLLTNHPVNRSVQDVVDSTSVTNRWKLKGAYYTARAGPMIWLPVSTRLRANVSAGPAMVVSGTYYTVTQSFQPALGAEITDARPTSAYSNVGTSSAYKVLPGYFADASIQFDLTERTGFFAGAVFQSARGYTQTLDSATEHYSTKIDFTNQQGLRAGMTIRF